MAAKTIRFTKNISAWLLLSVLIGAFILPSVQKTASVHAANPVVSKNLERQARHFLTIVRGSRQFSDDLQINSFVVSMAKNLGKAADLSDQPMHYFVLIDPNVNAFAGPGATFFVNTGLIEIADNEAELASVMAHEIAHFKQDHLSRLLKAHQSTKTPSLLAVLAGILIGGDAGIAAIVGAQAARVENVIDYTLSYEREADSVGVRILAKAGYHPKHAKTFMQSLEQEIRERGIVQSNIHNTHPVTPERIASINARLRQYNDRTFPDLDDDFGYFKARVRVQFHWESNKTYRYFEQNLATGTASEQAINLYGYALSLAKDGKLPEARRELARLKQRQPDNLWVILAEAEFALVDQQPELTLSLLEAWADVAVPHPAVIELYTKALLQTAQAEEANRYLRKHLASHPEHIQLLRLNAQTALQAGSEIDAYLSDADYHFQLGDLRIAINQLKFAESKSDDFYTVSVAREKIRLISEEIAWRESSN